MLQVKAPKSFAEALDKAAKSPDVAERFHPNHSRRSPHERRHRSDIMRAQAGVKRVDDLIRDAMLNPELARK
jgi:hypothetical protein